MKYLMLVICAFFFENHSKENAANLDILGSYQDNRGEKWTLVLKTRPNGYTYYQFFRNGNNKTLIFQHFSKINNNEIELCQDANGDCDGSHVSFKKRERSTCIGTHFTVVEFYYLNDLTWRGELLCP